MPAFKQIESWVVYRIALTEKSTPLTAVCLEDEWPEIQQKKFSKLTLIQSGIGSEGEAERIARTTI